MATNNAINLNKPVSSFMSINNADQADVTGDGTAYLVQFVNELYDNVSNFDGSSTFTAPQTGLYMIFFDIWMVQTAAVATDCNFYIVADGITYYLSKIDLSSGIGTSALNWVSSYSMLVSMTASSTAQIFVKYAGGTKVADSIGATAATVRTPYFSCMLLTGLI